VYFPEVDICNSSSKFVQALYTKIPYTIILEEFVLLDNIRLGLFQAFSISRINTDS
jgi:hypothetical protein